MRSGSKQRHFLCKYWPYHIIFKFCEKGRFFGGMSICSILSFKLNSQRISTVIYAPINVNPEGGGGSGKGGDLINQVVPWVGIWTDTFF